MNSGGSSIDFPKEYGILYCELLSTAILTEREREDQTMENKITVNICGTDYTLMAEESPSYMQ